MTNMWVDQFTGSFNRVTKTLVFHLHALHFVNLSKTTRTVQGVTSVKRVCNNFIRPVSKT